MSHLILDEFHIGTAFNKPGSIGVSKHVTGEMREHILRFSLSFISGINIEVSYYPSECFVERSLMLNMTKDMKKSCFFPMCDLNAENFNNKRDLVFNSVLYTRHKLL